MISHGPMGEVVQTAATLREIVEMRIDVGIGVGGKMLFEIRQLHPNPRQILLPVVEQVLIHLSKRSGFVDPRPELRMLVQKLLRITSVRPHSA